MEGEQDEPKIVLETASHPRLARPPCTQILRLETVQHEQHRAPQHRTWKLRVLYHVASISLAPNSSRRTYR